MVKIYSSLLVFFLLLTFSATTAKEGGNPWATNYQKQKVFIENKGQFHLSDEAVTAESAVKYAFDGGSTMIYFTKKGITYSLLKTWKKEEIKDKKEQEEEYAREIVEMKKGKTHQQLEQEEHKLEYKADVINMLFENSNKDAELLAEDETPDYHSYTFKDYTNNNQLKNVNLIKGFRKIIYKNIYPNIDIEYTFHLKEGLKYAVIVHPGADMSLLKMNYSKDVKIKEEQVHIETKFGDIVDHAPVTFYMDDKSTVISSHFIKNKRTVSFELGSYDHSKSLVIDPWVVSPSFATNWDCVWECERDGAGNAYLIGGVMPLQLLKYNAAGVLQWTYNTPYDTSGWLGTFATDLLGNSYVTQGSTAAIVKVSTTGALVWNNPNPGGLFASTEFWNISFNCDQTRLVIGGTGGFLPPLPYIYNVDMSNGNMVSSVQVTAGALFPTQEVRSITASSNGRYYFLSHDSIGYIDQNFTLCPGTGPTSIFHINNGYALGYKCENFRYDNSGIMAIRANRSFVYTQNGANLQKRSLSTLAVLNTVAIPGGVLNGGFGGNQVGNSGIDIDSCGNVYVGSTNAVIKYDANLNLITSSPTTYNVYDVTVSTGGNVIACGSTGNSGTATRTGKIQSFNMSACSPMIQFCCDATICNNPALCVTDPPITLTAASAGGIWSGTGITNAVTGAFNPATAGPGPHTVYYTLSCGMDSTVIQVNSCTPLNVCQNSNGTLTVSGGTGPYNWQGQVTTTPCIPGLGLCSGFGTVTGPPVTNWVTFVTGVTITPTVPYPIQVVDNSGTTFSIASLAALPFCTLCPALTPAITSQVNVSCFGLSNGSFNVTTSGGASPYSYTLMNGATTVATFNNVAGTQAFTALPAGTYTLNIVDNNACPGTATIIITQPSASSVATTGLAQTVCGNSATLAGNVPAVGTGNWVQTVGTSTITTPASATSTVTGLSAGLNVFQWTITNAPCPSTSSLDSITVGFPPTVAAAGPNQSLCSSSATFAGNAAIVGTGQWSLISGSGTITNPSSPTSTVTNLGLGANVFQWTISNLPCAPTTSQVTLTNTGGASSSVCGPAQLVCGNSATLAGNVPAIGVGAWSVTTGTGTIANTASPTSAVTALGPGLNVFEWTISNAPCPSTSSFDSITVVTPPTVANAGVNQSGCNSIVTIVGNTPVDGTGQWSIVSGSGTITNPTSPTSTVTGLGVGANVFEWTISNFPCTPSTSQVTITNTGGATTTITAQTNVLCFGNATGSATASSSGGASPYSYVWTGTSGVLQTANNITVPNTLNGLTAGSYTVTVTDNAGCTSGQNVTITQPAATLTLSVVNSINASCGNNNGSATVAAAGGTIGTGYQYSWAPSGGTNAAATNLGANTYTITATDANGCTATNMVTITNTVGPVISIASQTNVLCSGANTGAATTSVAGGTGTLTYNWTGGAGTNSSATNLIAGTYTVTVTDGSGCSNSATVTITQPPAITASVTATPTNCSTNTGTATVSAAGGTGTLNYVWNPGGATAATITNLSAGIYTVAITDLNGCTSSASGTVASTGAPAVDAGLSTFIMVGNSTTLSGSGGVIHMWSPASTLSCDTCLNTIASPTETTTYTLTVTDANGCTASDTVTVFVEIPCPSDKNLQVPNAFSPNADGFNDQFCLQGWNQCITQFTINIFDRWGEKVFESLEPDFCWDGTFKGKPLDPAVFVYYITGTLQNTQSISRKGNISLIR